MRALLFTSSLGGGGAERQLINLATELASEGLSIQILVYHRNNSYKELLVGRDIPVKIINQSSHILRLIEIRRYIRKGLFDVVISFLDAPNFANCFAAIGGKNWGVITSERSAQPEAFNGLRGRIFGFMQKYSDRIICNSYVGKRLWDAHYPEYGNKTEVIYNIVQIFPSRVQYIPRQGGRFRIIVPASYQYLKNPIGLIAALNLMTLAERRLFQIDWYGRKEIIEGDSRAYDEACVLIERHDLADFIRLNDFSADIHERMATYDAIGLFSKVEGLPNAVLEGMALGKPIIMSKVSDYERLIDSSNGVSCVAESPESIKNALLKLNSFTNEQLVEMGSRSMRRVKKLCSRDVVIQQWMCAIGRG